MPLDATAASTRVARGRGGAGSWIPNNGLDNSMPDDCQLHLHEGTIHKVTDDTLESSVADPVRCNSMI